MSDKLLKLKMLATIHSKFVIFEINSQEKERNRKRRCLIKMKIRETCSEEVKEEEKLWDSNEGRSKGKVRKTKERTDDYKNEGKMDGKEMAEEKKTLARKEQMKKKGTWTESTDGRKIKAWIGKSHENKKEKNKQKNKLEKWRFG